MKETMNKGKGSKLFFWRDSAGNEVDCILEDGSAIKAIEIKSAKTSSSSFFKGLEYWKNVTGNSNNYLVYGGDLSYLSNGVQILSWSNIRSLVV